MAADEFSTLWLLLGRYGATMSMEQLRNAFFPGTAIKTMTNKHSARLLSARTGDVYDTRDVSAWWDNQMTGRQRWLANIGCMIIR